MDQDLREYLQGMEARMEEREQRTEERFSRLEALMDQRFDEQRRHSEVLIEAVRGDVRLVAEGVASVNERLDAFQEDTARKFSAVDRRVTALEARASRRVAKKRPAQ